MSSTHVLRKIFSAQVANQLTELALDSALHQAGVIAQLTAAVDALASDVRSEVDRLEAAFDAARPEKEALGRASEEARHRFKHETDPDRIPLTQAEARIAEQKAIAAAQNLGGLQLQLNDAAERLAKFDYLSQQLQALEPPTPADVQAIVTRAIERREARAG